MTRKCDCKKCIYCKQFITGTSIYRVNCERYGENAYAPSYCDKYLTEKEYIKQEINKL
jgi:hypothetical protein